MKRLPSDEIMRILLRDGQHCTKKYQYRLHPTDKNNIYILERIPLPAMLGCEFCYVEVKKYV